MKLIAKKPCSFGGRKFFIDDEIPVELVTCPEAQEKLGVLTIADAGTDIWDLDLVTNDESATETVWIAVCGESDGESTRATELPATAEEVRQTFSIMQMSAEEGARAIADVTSENVPILLHAADSRKKIKNAAKERAGYLFPDGDDSDESTGGNESTGTDTEGADT